MMSCAARGLFEASPAKHTLLKHIKLISFSFHSNLLVKQESFILNNMISEQTATQCLSTRKTHSDMLYFA